MSWILRLAWRNTWRNQRRSLVTMAAMAFALFVMILYSGLVDGMLRGMQSDVLDLEVGDIQVFAPGWREDPSLYGTLDGAIPLIEDLEAAGFKVSPRLMGGGLAAAGEAAAGVSLKGLDVQRDAAVSVLGQRVASGQWLDPADPDGVVVGWRLARTLGVDVGSELIVLSQGADGSLANGLYQVRGVLMTVGDATDRAGVFMTEPAFRELMALPAGHHQLIVRTPADAALEPSVQALTALAEARGVAVEALSWRSLMPVIAQWIDSTRGLITLIFFIVYLAVGLLILNAMLMAVFERIKELGVMKALGMSPGRVLALILAESAVQAALAIVVGCAAAAPAAWLLATRGLDMGRLGGMNVMGMSMQPIWRGVYSVDSVLHPIAVLLVIVGMAMLYPALKGALVRPVEAMRHQA